MKKIVLISCVSKKLCTKAKAKDLYISTLFAKSLAYANSLNPDKIYILSALHHVVDLEQEIEPYDVTLSNVTIGKRKQGLKVLNTEEKIEWGKRVIEMLSQQADLENDMFIVLAGSSYIKPIKPYIRNLDDRLQGLSQGRRLRFLKNQLS